MADPRSDHATHDLEAIAELADDRTEGADALRAQAAECDACARLLDDLRLLARASATLAVPPRTRDFRLDPAAAARLTSSASEPELAPSRLGVDMTSPATDHALHDSVLIAAHVDGSLDTTDQARVDDWLARCGPCATLRDDMASLAIATRTLPTPTRRARLQPVPGRRQAGAIRRLAAAHRRLRFAPGHVQPAAGRRPDHAGHRRSHRRQCPVRDDIRRRRRQRVLHGAVAAVRSAGLPGARGGRPLARGRYRRRRRTARPTARTRRRPRPSPGTPRSRPTRSRISATVSGRPPSSRPCSGTPRPVVRHGS